MGVLFVDREEIEAAAASIERTAARGSDVVPIEAAVLLPRLWGLGSRLPDLRERMMSGRAHEAAALLRAHSGLRAPRWDALALLLFPVSFLAGAVFLFAEGAEQRGRAEASLSWPTTRATILAATVHRRTGRSTSQTRPTGTGGGTTWSTSFSAELRYRYLVAGASYEGATLSYAGSGHFSSDGRLTLFGDDFVASFGDRERAERALAPYPVGAEVDVRYDPSAPRRSVLEPGGGGFNLSDAMGLGFLCGSLFTWVVLRRVGRRVRRVSE